MIFLLQISLIVSIVLLIEKYKIPIICFGCDTITGFPSKIFRCVTDTTQGSKLCNMEVKYQEITNEISGNIDEVKEYTKLLFSEASKIPGIIQEKLQELFTMVNDFVKQIEGTIVFLIDFIKNEFTKVFDTLVQNIFSTFETFKEQTIDKLIAMFNLYIIGPIQNQITNILLLKKAIVDAITKLFGENEFTLLFEGLVNTLLEFPNTLVTWINNGIDFTNNNVTTPTVSTYNNISSTLVNLVNDTIGLINENIIKNINAISDFELNFIDFTTLDIDLTNAGITEPSITWPTLTPTYTTVDLGIAGTYSIVTGGTISGGDITAPTITWPELTWDDIIIKPFDFTINNIETTNVNDFQLNTDDFLIPKISDTFVNDTYLAIRTSIEETFANMFYPIDWVIQMLLGIQSSISLFISNIFSGGDFNPIKEVYDLFKAGVTTVTQPLIDAFNTNIRDPFVNKMIEIKDIIMEGVIMGAGFIKGLAITLKDTLEGYFNEFTDKIFELSRLVVDNGVQLGIFSLGVAVNNRTKFLDLFFNNLTKTKKLIILMVILLLFILGFIIIPFGQRVTNPLFITGGLVATGFVIVLTSTNNPTLPALNI